MRVVILGSQSSVHVVRWANALDKVGLEVYLITQHNRKEPINPGINVIRLRFNSPYGYVMNIPEVRRLVRIISPDFVHSFYALGYGFLGRFSAADLKILSVMGSDVYDDIEMFFPIKKVIIQNILQADKVCSTSYVMRERVFNLSGRNDIEITPFGVDIKEFRSINKIKNSDFTIGTVKLLEEKYGIDILLKSFSDFRINYPDQNIHLKIVGDGSLRDELKKLAVDLGISKDVSFIGYVPNRNIPSFLNNLDVFAAFSRLDSESFGVAVVEAMACQLPVVVSNVGGLKEVVVDKETGLVIENESIKEASNAFKLLFENKKIRNELSRRARKEVMEKYDWENSVSKMISIYEELILGEY